MSAAPELQTCPHCGGTEWRPGKGAEVCDQCGLTYEQAFAQVRHDRRQAEHRRRQARVVAATAGMPMQRRIRVAKFLLLENGPLPNGEPWDAAFRAWQEAGYP